MDQVAAIIPCFKCKAQILSVISGIGSSVAQIIVVDDHCPEATGQFVKENCHDPRVHVLFHEMNLGVGGAMITGYRYAKDHGATILVKLDGDGQMDPSIIDRFINPILYRQADYTKGNRFHDIEGVRKMPTLRLIGNAGLSFFCKLSSGYWDVFDPNNGYTAMSSVLLNSLPLDKIAKRYFFESDMLFRLNLARAVVLDVPMMSVYGDEKSNLKILHISHEFALRHMLNFCKRIFYNYFLRNFSVASMHFVVGNLLLAFGGSFSCYWWIHSARTGILTTAGTVMLGASPILIGIQFVLSFLNYDMAAMPRRPLTLDLVSSGNRRVTVRDFKVASENPPDSAPGDALTDSRSVKNVKGQKRARP